VCDDRKVSLCVCVYVYMCVCVVQAYTHILIIYIYIHIHINMYTWYTYMIRIHIDIHTHTKPLFSSAAQVKIFQLSSGFCFVTFAEHTAPVTAVAFLPSGHALVSASLDGTVRAYDLVRCVCVCVSVCVC
jgi:WD40 repeat protein